MVTYWLLQEPKYPNSLQELVEVIMEGRSCFRSIDIGVQLLRVGLNEWRLLELRVRVQVSESYPVVQRHQRNAEHDCKGPEVELRK